MKSSRNGLIVVIPSYEPTEAFVDYAKEVTRYAERVIVVNDGSSAEYGEIFHRISALEKVSYIGYEVNRGKGYALKAALRFCLSKMNGDEVIVTADCDGQHAVSDILRVYEATKARKNQLVLGSRSFSASNIPFRSRMGNSMIRNIYKLFYGLNLYDTQTGLRGFPLSLATAFEAVKGDRFEYEMNVLIYAQKHGIPIAEIPIRTIYPVDPKDHTSHYKAIRDSLRIFGVVLQNFNLYLISGALAGLLDISVFHLLTSVIFSGINPIYTLVATVTARVLSSILNFILNFKYVFRGASARSIVRYYFLWVCQLGASYGIAFLFGNLVGLPLTPVKLIGDLVLSLISYQIQSHWVFGKTASSRFYGGFVRFVRLLARIFTRKYLASVTPYGEPVVYVCRHLNLRGPIASIAWLSFEVHPLVYSPFFEKKECYRQYATYTFAERKGKKQKKRSVKAYLASRVVPSLMRSVGAVPVYRVPSKMMETMNAGLAHLLNGESLIVYPDVDYTADQETDSRLYDGFLYLGQMYQRKTGCPLRFVPLFLDEECKAIREGASVTVGCYRAEKDRALAHLHNGINGREQDHSPVEIS